MGSFVVGGNSGRIGISSDGFAWSNVSNPLGTGVTMYDVCYSPSLDRWLMVGSNEGIITSDDSGAGWTQSTSPFAGTPVLYACLWVEDWGLFIIAGDSGLLATSPTGLTGSWTTRTSGFGADIIYTLGYSPDTGYAIAGGGGGKVSNTTNGTTWTAQTPIAPGDILTVGWWAAGTCWIAAGSPVNATNTFKAAFVSTNNGASWTMYTTTINKFRGIWSGAGDDTYYNIGSEGAAEINYRTVGSTVWNSGASGGGADIYDIIYVESLDKWWWVGPSTVVALTSTDGLAWTTAGQTSPFTVSFQCIEYGVPAGGGWTVGSIRW